MVDGFEVPAATPAEALVLRALNIATDAPEAVTCPPLEGVKPHQKAVTKERLRDQAFSSGFADETEKRNTRNVRFSRTVESLAGKGKLRVHNDLVWPI